jgi:hypothetical protein
MDTAADVFPDRLAAPATAILTMSGIIRGRCLGDGVSGERVIKIMDTQTVRLFVESWTTCWTLVLGLGYLGAMMAWPQLAVLGTDKVVRLMAFASTVVVFCLCLSSFPAAAVSVTGWVIGITVIRRLVAGS